jgi:predicted DNA-binding transcriptional regulator AlpA
MREKLLATREVSHILGISEKEIIDLANNNVIPHFKLAGEFLRFRREDILRIKPAIKKKYNLPEKKYHTIEKVKDFFYFNDFYIISAAIIIVLLWVIIKGVALSS